MTTVSAYQEKLTSKIYIDFGNGFSEEDTLAAETAIDKTSINFNFHCNTAIKNICFMPCQNECIIEIKKIVCEHISGIKTPVDITTSNCEFKKNNIFYFVTKTPKFFCSIDRIVNNIIIDLKYISVGAESQNVLYKFAQEKILNLEKKLQSLQQKLYSAEKTIDFERREHIKAGTIAYNLKQDISKIKEQYSASLEALEKYKIISTRATDEITAIRNSFTWRIARSFLDPAEAVLKLFKTKSSHPSKSTEYIPTKQDTPPVGPLVRGAFYKNLPELLIVSHDASRTGAPLIIYHIGKILIKEYKINCIFILMKDGVLRKDFEALGETFVLEEWQKNPWNAGKTSEEILTEMMKEHNVRYAILNSAESHPLCKGLRALGIHFIALIHEFIQNYLERGSYVFKTFTEYADEIIFPASIVREYAEKQIGTIIQASVRPQGLFDASFPRIAREKARIYICKELGVQSDAFIVLGCGYVDARKGCDLFISVAKMIHRRRPDSNIVFVWAGSMTPMGVYKQEEFIEEIKSEIDFQSMSGQKIFHFIGERRDPAPWFAGADCFFMSSRLDPFPCVVLEAMASRLPVICFDKTTGSVEALEEGTGFVVGHLDLDAASEKILYLADNPDKTTEIGENARNKVLNHYKYEDYVKELGNIILKHRPNTFAGTLFSGPIKKRRKLFIPCYNWGLSGVNTAIEIVGKALIERDWDVRILFTRSEYDVRKSANDDLPIDVPYDFISFPDIWDQKILWRNIIYYLEGNAPCIMLTGYDFTSNSIIPALSDSVGAVLWNQSDDKDYYEQAYRLGHYCHNIVCVSEYIGKRVKEINPAFTKKVKVIPNSAIFKHDLLESKTHSSGPLKLIYTGRLVHYQKRVKDFEKLVLALEKEDIPFELTLIGSDCDGSGNYLRQQLTPQIKNGTVKILDRQERTTILHTLAEQDIFLLLSDFEGLSLSLLEAMSQGCVPVVAAMDSGLTELISTDNGRIIDSRDYSVWAKELKILSMDNKTLLKNLANNAIETIRQKFIIENVVNMFDNMFLNIYNSIKNGTYKRPETLKWQDSKDDILRPPLM